MRRMSDVAADLHKLALELNEPRILTDAILQILANGGKASGAQLSKILRRRTSSVIRACKQLESERRITRAGHKWTRVI